METNMAIGLETLVVLFSLLLLVVLAVREFVRLLAKRVGREADELRWRSEQSLTSLERCVRAVLTLSYPKPRRARVRVPSNSWKNRQ